MSARTTLETVTIVMPHPPASLSPNGSTAHWAVRGRDAKRVRHDAAMLTRQAIWEAGDVGHPWPGAVMDIQWQFAGIQPDADNVIARLKAAIDGIADACLIENDRTIRIGAVTFERVSRADRCVVITLTKED